MLQFSGLRNIEFSWTSCWAAHGHVRWLAPWAEASPAKCRRNELAEGDPEGHSYAPYEEEGEDSEETMGGARFLSWGPPLPPGISQKCRAL